MAERATPSEQTIFILDCFILSNDCLVKMKNDFYKSKF
jgi:hypothetical protein